MSGNTLILSPLHKALDSLFNALSQEKDEFIRDAVIQRFEYTYELCWKTMKRFLREEASSSVDESTTIKNIYREAARVGLIDNLDDWFRYHTARNMTSHTYNEKTAEETYEIAKLFAKDAKLLLTNLQKINHDTSDS